MPEIVCCCCSGPASVPNDVSFFRTAIAGLALILLARLPLSTLTPLTPSCQTSIAFVGGAPLICPLWHCDCFSCKMLASGVMFVQRLFVDMTDGEKSGDIVRDPRQLEHSVCYHTCTTHFHTPFFLLSYHHHLTSSSS